MTSLNKKSQRKQYINLLTLLFRQLISFLYRTHTCFFDNYEKHEGKNEKKKKMIIVIIPRRQSYHELELLVQEILLVTKSVTSRTKYHTCGW